MKDFTKKGFVQKIIIVLIFLTAFNFIYPYIPAFAAESDEDAPGGILLEPLLSLFSSLGEGIIWVCQSQLLGMGTSNFYVDTGESFWGNFWGFLAGGAVAVASFFIPPIGLGVGAALTAGSAILVGSIAEDQIPDSFYLPLYKISPQEIFSDQIPALHINFINPKNYDEETAESADEGLLPVYNSAKELGPQIAKWYVALRNLVLVALMVILLYIGIRIVISSTASEKAKYLQHIKDWLIAVILVVFMHYIMAFALTITEYITSMLNKQNEIVYYNLPAKLLDEVSEEQKAELEQYIDEDGNLKFATNLMGSARIKQQIDSLDDNGNNQFTWSYIGYTIIYLTLVIYTVMFLIIYLKRVIYMAFLTMIAPLVALTYPIDKLSDGQAQAFNMWLKEYVFNLLLQPFHLLLYTLLVGSVMDLASSNMIYALVALGFLLPAESLLRKFFGFEKASTTGSIVGGVVGGSLAMNAIKKLGNLGSGSGSKKGTAENSEGEVDTSRIRTADRDIGTNDQLIAEGFGGNNTQALVGEGNNTNENPQNIETNQPIRLDSNPQSIDSNNSESINPTEPTEPIEPIRFNSNQGPIDNDSAVETPTRMQRIKNSRAGKVAIAGAKTGGHYLLKGAKGVGKRAPRLLARGALGLATGTVGVAAGLASGDLSNVVTYGGAAAAVGSSLGNSAVNAIGRINTGANSLEQEYLQRRYTTEELEARENEEIDKKWAKSQETIKLYKDKFGDDYKEAINTAREYRKYGITDDKAIIGAQKLEGLADTNKASKERIALAKAATMVTTEKEMKAYGDRMKDNGISEEKIKEVKKNIRKINKM